MVGKSARRHIVERRVSSGPLAGPAALAVLLVLALLLVLTVGTAARAAETLDTATGLHAVVHTAPEIMAEWISVDAAGRTWFQAPGVDAVELDATQHPWDTLTPLPMGAVLDAVRAMHGFSTAIDLQIFILPGLPVETLGSFSRHDAVFLAPALGQVAASTVAYLTTHEIGHVMTWAALDGRAPRWSAYLSLRGVPATAFGADVPHADRAREILAEDCRQLFGGPLATQSGTIENASLPLPETVDGLRDLLVGFLADTARTVSSVAELRAFPNPCNPRTTVELSIPAGADVADAASAVLDVYDLRGQRVSTVRGGEWHDGRVEMVWPGTGHDGARIASGTYTFVLRLGDVAARGRVTVVR